MRFDGVKFTTFTAANTDGMFNDNINALFEDTNETLWIGTEGGGLIQRKHGAIQSLFASDPGGPAVISNLCEDGQGTLWVGTPNGLYQLINGKLEHVSIQQFKGETSGINSICADQLGRLWVNIENETFRKQGNSWEAVPELKGYVRMTSDRSGGIWAAGSDAGLAHLVNGELTKVADLDGENVQQICLAKDGLTWISTSRNGLIGVNGEKGASPNEGRPPSALPPRRTPTTLVSLGGATLCEALTSPCETAILRIGAVETPDCLDVSVFPLCLLVRICRRKVGQGSTECRPTGPQGLKLESYPVKHFSPIVLLGSPASAHCY